MDFLSDHTGEFAALLTAIFWTITALAFESASKRLGSVSVNLLRLLLGFIFLSIFNLIYRGNIFPSDASGENWLWLVISGLIGFVLGDLFLFKSYTIIGSRFAMLIMTLVPPVTAFFGWLILNERMELIQLLGMTLTFSGIAMAIFSRPVRGIKMTLKLAPLGILYALGGVLGQALGLIFSKMGVKDYDPFAATQIRIIAGIAGFAMMVTIMGRWSNIRKSLSDRQGMKSLSLGSFFGPFLGVSFSLVSVKFTQTGIASTLMAMVPIFIIAPSVIIYKEKVSLSEIIGAVLSVAGVALFFI